MNHKISDDRNLELRMWYTVWWKTLAGENICEFSCLDYVEEKTLANNQPIKYRY